MNKKLVFRSEDRGDFYCILSGDMDFDKQLNRLIYGSEEPRHGVCVCLKGDTLDFVDYFHAERMGYHQLLRIEDTDEPLSIAFFNQ